MLLSPAEARARRVLFAGIVFFVVTHVVALAAMALVLRNGMDPSAGSASTRMVWVELHPLAWRLGWLPWQLSALSDLWVSAALLVWARARGDAAIVRLATIGLALDVVGVIPEQWAEAMLVTSFVDGGSTDAWRAAWTLYAELTGVWANWAYTAMTACWMAVAAALLGRAVTHRRAEHALVVLFVLSGLATLVAMRAATDAACARAFVMATALNGLAFPALTAWTCVLAMRLRAR